MTTIMNQVLCSLCNKKFDELKWMDHLVSMNLSELCKYDKDKNAIKFFERKFSAYSNKSEKKS